MTVFATHSINNQYLDAIDTNSGSNFQDKACDLLVTNMIVFTTHSISNQYLEANDTNSVNFQDNN